ncbi:MAG: FHA domain-containing serine/threonine-protein kinase, partial [Planctomycetota bacterium]
MIPGLLITAGPKKGTFLDLPENKSFWIGRTEPSDFVPENNPNISGKHCCFLRQEGILLLKDESLNGTWLNGRLIHRQQAILQNTDIIHLGKTYFQIIDRSQNQDDGFSLEIQKTLERFQNNVSENIPKNQDLPYTKLGDYQLIEILGQGSFGTVYKAVHPVEKKFVALKVFSEECDLEDIEILARFFREIELLEKLSHPHIIKIYEGIYSHKNENPSYIALEYFPGVNLDDYVCAQGPIPWINVSKILLQTTLALQEMHRQKILHRDLKPNNILYHPYQCLAKVIDFGLGKCLRIEERKNFFTTRPRSSLGTPNFMPIEQWLDFKNLDERADIYSLGATAYFLLSGRYPYKQNYNLIEIYTHL